MAALFANRGMYFMSGMRRLLVWSVQPAAARQQVAPGRTGCALCGRRQIHLSEPLSKQRKHKEVRKITFKPKSKSDLVKIWRNMTVAELAASMGKPIDDIYTAMLFVNNTDDYDEAHKPITDIRALQDIVKRCGGRPDQVAAADTGATTQTTSKDVTRRPPPADPSRLPRRPPVVTIMGHVDHGKTTLLDALRHSHVVDGEFGGITQHIGAFRVELGDDTMTFLDTPGHAAFAAMRQRGALATDLVVLVVAADDGVMAQTKESLRFAAEAGVPLLVAINKCDKPAADVAATMQSLLVAGVQLEDVGGDVQSVQISALRGDGLTELKEAILALAEMLELRGDKSGRAEGVIIESRTDAKRGRLCTVLVQRGTLRRGAVLVAGTCTARVRAMFDDAGRPVQAAPPGTPVEVLGWRDLPGAGLEVLEVDAERHAREVTQWRQNQESLEKAQADGRAAQERLQQHLADYRAAREERLKAGRRYSSRKGGRREKEADVTHTGPTLSVVVKGDVDGSVEAILDVLDTYHSPDVRLDLLHYGVGNITESDVEMAKMFDGIVYGFNVEAAPAANAAARTASTPIRHFNVIYRLVDDVRREIDDRMPVRDVENVIGEANVLQEFVVTEGRRKIPVAGCRCVKGMLKKSENWRLVREGEVLHEGKLASMRHLKSEVDTIKKDVECGLMLDDSEVRFQSGDTLVCFGTSQQKQTTDWDPGF